MLHQLAQRAQHHGWRVEFGLPPQSYEHVKDNAKLLFLVDSDTHFTAKRHVWYERGISVAVVQVVVTRNRQQGTGLHIDCGLGDWRGKVLDYMLLVKHAAAGTEPTKEEEARL